MGPFEPDRHRQERGDDRRSDSDDRRRSRRDKDRKFRKRRTGWAGALFNLATAGAMLLGLAYLSLNLSFGDPLQAGKRERTGLVRILARDGTLLAERGGSNSYIPLDLLPQHVRNAVVATEDHRFWQHWGIDPIGLTRATLRNMSAGHTVEGGSTLTQQLAKNLFLGPERTVLRKLEEVVLAIWLELKLSKSDILELYLNRAYFGSGAYGIEAAAQRYFDKSARELSLMEAAVLAGLLKAPSKLSPTQRPEQALERGKLVLARMLSNHLIGDKELKEATRRPPVYVDADRSKDGAAYGHAIDVVLERLRALVGTADKELIVETTIDAGLQRQAQATLRSALAKADPSAQVSEGAAVILELDGSIRVLIGGRSYAESQFNRAVKAHRQPGSAFKPIVYLTALEHGYRPSTQVEDLPVSVRGWSPHNDGGQFRGVMSLREALARSVNTVAVRLAMNLGTPQIIATARRLGITATLSDGPALALGASELTLLELTGAYAPLANGGTLAEPHIVRRIKSSSGRVLYARPGREAALTIAAREVAFMNDMLTGAVSDGTGKRAKLKDRPSAGKTGTTQDNRDAWFIGYTGELVAGVWVGNDNRSPMHGVTGGGLPAEIWHDIMTLAHGNRPPVMLPGAVPPSTPMAFLRGMPSPQPSSRETPNATTLPKLAQGPVATGRPPAAPFDADALAKLIGNDAVVATTGPQTAQGPSRKAEPLEGFMGLGRN